MSEINDDATMAGPIERVAPATTTINHDRLFKELLTIFFLEFIRLFLPDIAAHLDPASLKALDKEIFSDVTAGERHEVDIIMEGRVAGEDTRFLIHVENQSTKQADFGKRMHRYFARLYEKHDVPVLGVAVLSYDQPYLPEPNQFVLRFLNRKILEYNYDVVQLNQLDWHNYLANPNPVASALMAKMKIAPSERPIVKAQSTAMLFGLKLDKARTQLVSGFVETYLPLDSAEKQVFEAELDKLIPPQEKERVMQVMNSWTKEGLLQGRQEGLQEGRQEGRQEGLELGRREGELDLLLRLLNRKFDQDSLPSTIQERVQALSDPNLTALGEALLDFISVADLTIWLAQH